MVEVDPLLLLAAGATVLGVASVLICTVKPAPAPKVEKPAPQEKVKVGKKKVRKSASSRRAAKAAAAAGKASETETEMESLLVSEEETAAAKPKEESAAKADAGATTEGTQDAASSETSDDDDDDDFEMRLVAAKKPRKPKETPEQKAARLERKRLKQAAKEAEELLAAAAAAAAPPAPSDDAVKSVPSGDEVSSPDTSSGSPSHFDGWAVVESHRKKKEEEQPTVEEKPAPVAEKGKKKKGGKESSGSSAAAAEETAADAEVAEVEPAPQLVVDSVTTEISVEAKKMGLLIGPKGATKIGIQNATAVEITMPKTEKDQTGEVTISITGPAAGVGKATAAINELCSKGYTMLLAAPDFQEGYIAVHQRFLPDIIGKGGSNIRAIQNHTGVKISMPAIVKGPKDAAELSSKVRIGLAGPRDQVTECRYLIKDLIKYYHTPVTHPGVVHAEVDIPASYYNYVIGSKGSEIKHIQGNYSVSVYIPNADTACSNILVVGKEENVGKAVGHIHKIVEKVDAANEKYAAEQAAREAEAAARAAAAAAAREARQAAREAAARGANADGEAPVAYSIGGGANLAVDRPVRRRKDESEPRVPGDEWMDTFAPPTSRIAISSMLPSQFASTDNGAEENAKGDGSAASTPAAEKTMEFPTPAEVRSKNSKGGASETATGSSPGVGSTGRATASVEKAEGTTPAAGAAVSSDGVEVEEGEVVETKPSAWNN